MQINNQGTLYVVATPIGNMQDITLRAIETLKSVDEIGCEDTRHAAHLLNHFGIKKPSFSLHALNEKSRFEKIQQALAAGKNIAIISDAGTPLISDPGYHIVTSIRAAGFAVIPIPGPCAAITALSAAGLPTDGFLFVGFLPSKSSQRQQKLQALAVTASTLIFYEAPHRLVASLDDLCLCLGEDRPAVVAREMTKRFETFVSGTLAEVRAHFQQHTDQVRGEVVILVRGAADQADHAGIAAEQVLKLLLAELPVKKAAKLTSEITGMRKNEAYALALKFTQKM